MLKYLIFIIIIIFTSSACKKQCAILEEKIENCRDTFNSTSKNSCSFQNSIYKNGCDEIENAYTLINDIMDDIERGSDNQQNLENICSAAINNIEFDNCNSERYLSSNWEENRYFMDYFGKKGFIEERYSSFSINLSINIPLNYQEVNSEYCQGNLLESYRDNNLSSKNMDLKFNILKHEDDEYTILRDSNNLFVGENYFSVNNTQKCDFNKLIDEIPRLGIDYCDYDLIFCSKSSGWLKNTSNCALNRQEVFLINFKKDPLRESCENSCRKDSGNNSCGNSNCDEGCNYSCIKNSRIYCDQLYNDEDCKTLCIDQNCENYIDCYWNCFQNEENSSICIENENCNCEDECRYTEDPNCIKKCKISSCYSDKCIQSCNNICPTIDESLECETDCNNRCNEDSCKISCKNSCSDDICNNYCSDSSDLNCISNCKLDNEIVGICDNRCIDECRKFSIDPENSKMVVFFREAISEKSGSHCDYSLIFAEEESDGVVENRDYCFIEFNITQKED